VRLDKQSPIPLYYQLAEQLREQIESGLLPPGSQLPAERELSEQSAISRMTVRQAVAYLVRAGVLEVKPGVGTFVAAPKHTYDALHVMGFTAEWMRRGSKTATRVLEQAIVTPPRTVANALTLQSEDRVVKVVRLRFAEEVPLLLETIFIPKARCPGLEEADLQSQSLYQLLEEQYALRLDRARQWLEATVVNDYEATLFGLPLGFPMILLEGITYAEADLPVEYFKAVYRGDRVRFALESRRNGRDAQPHQAPSYQSALVPIIDP
jgi:GntR family transcriptional regulator